MSEKRQVIFAQGMRADFPGAKAPDFVKCRLSIKVTDFIQFLNGQNKEWVNIDVKQSKAGKLYCELNTFVPKSIRQEVADHSDTPF
jgi:hypothetical protein